ncbi:MAG: transcriptional regulator [Gemmatimonadales bacterium]
MTAERVVPVMPDIDEFLHELARLKLLTLLSALKRADFVFLLHHSGLTRGNLSVQMSKLAAAGLVTIDKSFVGNRPRTMYALTKQGSHALAAYKEGMTALLAAVPERGRAA